MARRALLARLSSAERMDSATQSRIHAWWLGTRKNDTTMHSPAVNTPSPVSTTVMRVARARCSRNATAHAQARAAVSSGDTRFSVSGGVAVRLAIAPAWSSGVMLYGTLSAGTTNSTSRFAVSETVRSRVTRTKLAKRMTQMCAR